MSAGKQVTAAKRARASDSQTVDRRVRRTHELLHEALFRLIREKDYHRISVSEILERANIGRSTFYTHYRDKEDLFASAVQEMLNGIRPAGRASSTGATERIIGFALPVLEHIHRHRSAGGAHMDGRGRAVLHEHVRRVLAGWIAEEIVRKTGRARKLGRAPPDLLAQYIASTFVLVLDWWVDRNCIPAPAQADELFRSLVVPAFANSPME